MRIALLVVVLAVSAGVLLIPEQPLTFVYEPHSEVVREGTQYTLRSQANRNCQYQWYKDNEILPGATNSNFVIPYMLEGDGGVYMVQATSYNKRIYSRIATIEYRPLIKVIVENDMVTMDADGPIRYTLDGSEPTSVSSLYLTPLLITQPCVLRAVVGLLEMEYVRIELDKRGKNQVDGE